MTTSTCAHCGNPLAAKLTGRPGRFCDDRCRAAARRALAAEQARLDRLPTAATETPQRPSWAGRDYGDGDLCAQDPAHGHMYFMKATRHQWCPSSLHEGPALYAYDGVTPLRPARPTAESPGQARRSPEAPAAGVSLPPQGDPAPTARTPRPSAVATRPNVQAGTNHTAAVEPVVPGRTDAQLVLALPG